MTTVNEAASTQNTPLNAALQAGLEMISYNGEVKFTRYVKMVLPLDGSVFWVKADLVNPSTVPHARTRPLNFTAKGSFHYSTDISQLETEISSTNRIVFTSQDEVVNLNKIDPVEMYVGMVDNMKFAFSSRGSFYRQADIFHYVGHAVYNVLDTQIIDDPAKINLIDVVVSNSLPIWLSMNNYKATDYEYFSNSIPLYPSYLAPQNLVPPFATVHVMPEGTTGLAEAPNLGSTLTHDQLTRDSVRIVMYGVRSDDALTFHDFINQFSVNTDLIGIMNIPIIRDDKRPQVEFATLAQRKTIEFEVSYYQTAARNVARQLIEHALIHYYYGSLSLGSDLVPPPP